MKKILELLKSFFTKNEFVFKNINVGNNSGPIGDNNG